MATDKQIAANKINARKCTGPRTEEGKAKSSQNALKTGLDAKSEVLRFESRADYEALTAAFYARYRPTMPEDCPLIDMLIRNEWLLRRYMSVDTAIWEYNFYTTAETSLGATFLKNHQALDHAGRRINWAQRNYQAALRQLTDIRAQRAAQPESESDIDEENVEIAAEPEAQTKPLTPELVSFSSNEQTAVEIPSASGREDPCPDENPDLAA